MSGFRLPDPAGDRVDRARPLKFSFNGEALSGFQGDTLASALLASGVCHVGRSFKLHRPRGITGSGVEEPTALFDIDNGAYRVANVRATDIALVEGLQARTGNAWPSLRRDLAALNGWASRFLPAGFYYKTFMRPRWTLFEPFIRRAAGLGHAGEGADPDRYDAVSLHVEVLVVGGGLAGLQAATAAAESGRDVLLLEAQPAPGGWAASAGQAGVAQATAAAYNAGVELRMHCTAIGLYDHQLVCAVEAGSFPYRERLLRIRAHRIILATGAFDRPLLFPDNDRPGVMQAHAAEHYAVHHGVAVGRRVVIATACDEGLAVAARLKALGIEICELLDRRRGDCIVGVQGSRAVSAVHIARDDGSQRRVVAADAVLHLGGITPNVHLHSTAGGRLHWDTRASMFVPEGSPRNVIRVGGCAGAFELDTALEHARAVGRGAHEPPTVGGLGVIPAVNVPSAAAIGHRRNKTFVDLQNDVTVDDVALAARENYRSVEHLKRYTTLGMATDQGKSSNVNGLVLMGEFTGQAPDSVGTTRFRPPYKPVTISVLAAGRTGHRYRPIKRMPGHRWHEARGALFEEFSGWLRPAAYPRADDDLASAAAREAFQVRQGVGLFEGSPLGKIEVVGPDAADFLDLMYVGTMSTLHVGGARYGALLNENGVVVDDGIVARLGPQHFWVNTTSGGADRVALAFEEWLQCEYVQHRVFVQPVTAQWGNVTVSGPQAWALLQRAGLDASLAPGTMKHMTMRSTQYEGQAWRVLRASFSGELGYEINLPASQTEALLNHLWSCGQALDVCAYGVEALMTLRIEKGYLHVGADTDGTTLPQDVGLARGAERKAANFVGRRSLNRPAGCEPDRLQLVGLQPVDRLTAVPVGAHLSLKAPPCEAEGFVTSSTYSPWLRQPVALARLKRGRERMGERLKAWHLGGAIPVEVVPTPFVDPTGERQRG